MEGAELLAAAPRAVAPPLTLTLFGPMQVLVQGRSLPHLRSRKALWLLALLALRKGQAVERVWLAETLWPDMSQDQASAVLRPILSEVRKALEDQGERLQSPNRHSLRFDLTGADVDVIRFDAAIKSQNLSALETAVSLCQAPLLEGCPEEWVLQERAEREQSCIQALQKLAEAARLAHDLDRAARYFRQALSLDPWRDALQRGLMEVLAQGGDRNGALQVYREFTALLRSDPRAVPDEQTSALYSQLRAKVPQQMKAPATAMATETKGEAALSQVSPPAIKGYLPHPLTALVGRVDECLEVAARLRRSRLVTLTGLGGIGKTRLAIEVAQQVVREYADGIWLVALDALSDPARIPARIAEVMGIKDEPGRNPLEALTVYLRSRHFLLVLDNCEHVLEASAQVTGHLLQQCAGGRVLATSRAALGITGEEAWIVPSLPVPDPDHLPASPATLLRVLPEYEGVRLFIERAKAVQRDFSLTAENMLSVARICAQLEGLPLAIELAAVRVRAMTAQQVAARLDDHLSLLAGGSRTAQLRQQTLRATLDWSYALLSVPEQLLLARLSAFTGGWSLEAAEAVCAGEGIEGRQVADLLTGLVDSSLVVFDTASIIGAEEDQADSRSRYRLLETVRQYARERLGIEVTANRVGERHRDWFLALAEMAEPHLKDDSQAAWLATLEREQDNFRAALTWSETGRQDTAAEAEVGSAGLRLSGSLWWFWRLRGRYSEGRQFLAAALAHTGAQKPTLARAKALNAAGGLAINQGDYTTARASHEESLVISREHGFLQQTASALNHLGNVSNHLGDHASAKPLYEESLSIYREQGDQNGIAIVLTNLGSVTRQQGDYAAAQAQQEECLSIHRSLGNRQGIAQTLANVGNVMGLRGNHQGARELFKESLSLCRDLGDRVSLAFALSYLGATELSLGNYSTARLLFEESLGIRRELGAKPSIAWSLHNLGVTTFGEGHLSSAQNLLEESLSLFQELGDRSGAAWSRNRLGDILARSGASASATENFNESLRTFRELGSKEGVAENLRDLAALCAAQAERTTATRAACLWGAAEALREDIGAPLPPMEQEKYDQQVAQAREWFGEDVFAVAWEEGRALSGEQAAAYALEET